MPPTIAERPDDDGATDEGEGGDHQRLEPPAIERGQIACGHSARVCHAGWRVGGFVHRIGGGR